MIFCHVNIDDLPESLQINAGILVTLKFTSIEGF